MWGNPRPESCVMLFTTLCKGWILKTRTIKIFVAQKYQNPKIETKIRIPESCVMLFTTLCTGWILKTRTIKICFPQKYQKSEIGKTSVYIPP